jgi:hypothetical protein
LGQLTPRAIEKRHIVAHLGKRALDRKMLVAKSLKSEKSLLADELLFIQA